MQSLTNKQHFHRYPNINPETGRQIKIGGQTYQRLTKKYGKPKIVTNKDIVSLYENINQEIMPVKDEHLTPLYQNKDILYNIMLNAPVDTIKSLCLTHKLSCHDKHFWIEKFKHDELNLIEPYPLTLNEWIKEYIKMDEIKRVIDQALETVNNNKYYVIEAMFKSIKDIEALFDISPHYVTNVVEILVRKLNNKYEVSLARVNNYNKNVNLLKSLPATNEIGLEYDLTSILKKLRYMDHQIYQ